VSNAIILEPIYRNISSTNIVFCFKIFFSSSTSFVLRFFFLFFYFWHNNRFHHWLYFRFKKSNQFSDLQFVSSYQNKIYCPIDCRYILPKYSFDIEISQRLNTFFILFHIFSYFTINTFLASISFLSFRFSSSELFIFWIDDWLKFS